MKKIQRLLFLFLVLVIAVIPLGAGVALAATAYSVDWVSQFGTTSTEHISSVAVDGLGYAYATGDTSTAFATQTHLGNQDAFVIKYTGAGTLEWVRQFGTNMVDRAQGVAADVSGNSWVVGDTYGELVDGINFSGSDAFIRMYDSSGVAQWTDQFGTTNHCYARGVAVDSDGNAYVVGYCGASLDGQPYLLGYDAYIRKYNSAGVKQWTHQFGTSSSDYAYAVAVDDSGNAYVGGKTGGTLPGQTKTGLDDAFVRMYDGDGNVQWTCQFGTTKVDNVEGVAVDSSGNIYAAGYTLGNFPGETYSGGDNDAFMSKIDSTGTLQWAHQFGTGGDTRAQGASVDDSGKIFAAGYTNGALPGQTSMGGLDAYVRQYDSAGSVQWTYQYGTLDGGNAADDSAYGIATDASGNIFTAGLTDGQFPCYPDHSWDGFLMKLIPPAAPSGQVWYLDSTVGAGGYRVMEKTVGTQGGTVPVEGTTELWLSNQPAGAGGVVFDDGTWTVHLENTFTGDYSIQIGQSNGTHDDFTAFHYQMEGTAAGSIIRNIDLTGISVLEGNYLALLVNNTGTGSVITDGNSFLGAPSSTPDYPLPEIATGILLAVGLAGLGAIITIRRRRVKAAA